MKLFELIHEPTLAVRVENALKTMDWDFDVDALDELRVERGAKALRDCEVLVGALHTTKPELAQTLWETYCKWALPGSLPASVIRR